MAKPITPGEPALKVTLKPQKYTLKRDCKVHGQQHTKHRKPAAEIVPARKVGEDCK